MKTKNNILIVDDIPENLELLTDLLFTNGINVTIAENAEQTFSAIKRKVPDLILLDINLPEINGFQICEQLKKNHETSLIPIIFLTAKVSTEDIVKGFNLGAVDYITKPFNTVELLSRVRTHLELKKTREELLDINLRKDKFFAAVSKDIKNSYLEITEKTQNIKKNIKSSSLESIDNNIDALLETLKDGQIFLDSLLEWSGVQTGEMKYVPKRINLKSIIEPIFSFLRSTVAIQKGIIFYSMLTSSLEVFGDEKMIQLIVKNIALNLLNNSKSGDEITISAEEKNNFIEITISDSSAGNNNNLENIFDLDNFQNNENKKRNLDLILAKQLIEKHNGELTIKKGELGGRIFKFTIQKNRI